MVLREIPSRLPICRTDQCCTSLSLRMYSTSTMSSIPFFPPWPKTSRLPARYGETDRGGSIFEDQAAKQGSVLEERTQLLHPRGIQGMDRPFEEGATDDPSSRQGRVHGRGADDKAPPEDGTVRAS